MNRRVSDTWRDDEAFVVFLIAIRVAYRLYNTVVHRIQGGENGANIVWEAWKEGVGEGQDEVRFCQACLDNLALIGTEGRLGTGGCHEL